MPAIVCDELSDNIVDGDEDKNEDDGDGNDDDDDVEEGCAHMFFCFLAVQNSSIGDLVTHSLTD